MVSLGNKPAAKRVWFDDDHLWVELKDGRTLGVPLVFFPRLLRANESQRNSFEISGGGTGLHWDDVDEDISVEGLLYGIGDRTRQTRPGQIIQETIPSETAKKKWKGATPNGYGLKTPTSPKKTKPRTSKS